MRLLLLIVLSAVSTSSDFEQHGGYRCGGASFEGGAPESVAVPSFPAVPVKYKKGGWGPPRKDPIRILPLFAADVNEVQRAAVHKVVDFFSKLLAIAPSRRTAVHVVRGRIANNLIDPFRYDGFASFDKEESGGGATLYSVADYDYVLFVGRVEYLCKWRENADGFGFESGHDSTTGRPVFGAVVLCRHDRTYDFFYALIRHEILHALGYVLVGDRDIANQGVRQCSLEWWVGEDQSRKKNAYYATRFPRTTEVVRDHFKCATLPGIEVEDKVDSPFGVHLHDRLFATDIMSGLTPPCTREYFSNITATILEELRRGNGTYWYAVNRMHIAADIRDYSYGKGMGCVFAMRSCRQYYDWAVGIRPPISPFPFCNPYDVGVHNVCLDRNASTQHLFVCNRISPTSVYAMEDGRFDLPLLENWRYFEDYKPSQINSEAAMGFRLTNFCPTLYPFNPYPFDCASEAPMGGERSGHDVSCEPNAPPPSTSPRLPSPKECCDVMRVPVSSEDGKLTVDLCVPGPTFPPRTTPSRARRLTPPNPLFIGIVSAALFFLISDARR